jgi:sigma-B regulation protein RsbU (phosphoserine phosphatase)
MGKTTNQLPWGSQVLESRFPQDASAAARLREYLPLVRQMSWQRSPEDLLRLYRSRAKFIIPHDHSLTLTRQATTGCQVRVMASTLLNLELDPWREPEQMPLVESGLLCQLMRAGQAVKVDDLRVEPQDPAAPYVAGMRSLAAAPVFEDGEPLHLVILLRAEPAAFSLDDLSTVLLTANLVGQATRYSLAAQRAEAAYVALDREFHAIGQIQRDLLPRELPRIAGLELATYYETSARAGGDYYDFFPLPDGNWGFFLADVSGHGAAAAVVMARIHALLHAPLQTCPAVESSPQRVLAALNRALISSMQPGAFVTALYGILDVPRRLFCYSIAGHNPPRWFRAADRSCRTLESTYGLPLAVVEPLPLTQRTVQFDPGDRLLLYTDGVTETFNLQREMFGIERLDAAICRGCASAAHIVEAVVSDLRAFSAAPASDDRTLVAVAFEKPG